MSLVSALWQSISQVATCNAFCQLSLEAFVRALLVSSITRADVTAPDYQATWS